jgi:hypothetical protein
MKCTAQYAQKLCIQFFLVDRHVFIKISCTLKFQSGVERLQVIPHGS